MPSHKRALTLWWRMRGKPGNPFLHPFSGDLSTDVEALRREGYQWIFIDTVPAMLDHIEHAIQVADFALLPTRVSLFDLAATRDVVAICKEHKKPFAFVLNATDAKWTKGITSALAVLKKLGPVIPKSIRQRTVYASAITTGRTGPERDKVAADEIAALWAAVKKLAARAAQ
jgi:chromosome partitioning protein